MHRIPELDGVRGIAILAVLLLHFHAPFLRDRPLGVVSDVIGRGFTGVDIFFVLSGFLITSILISTRGASNYFSAFYARRSLRIFPVAFVAIALFYWLGVPFAHRHGLLPKLPESEQIWYWLFLGNWRQGLGFNDGAELGHFWSLAIEEQFYLMFSLFARYLPQRVLVSVSAALALLSIALRIALTASGHAQDPLLWRVTFLHLDPLAFGALLACSGRLLASVSRWRWAFLLVGLAGLFAPLPAGGEIVAGGVMATGLVAMAATRSVSILRNPILRSCGKYSYAMYVLHPAWIVHPLAKKHPHSMPLMLASLILGPIVSYGIAVVSWNLLEKHFLRLKRHFPYRFSPAGDTTENIIIAA
jgi:peptidoglycan/LPS O-acetylase OafA/YrhL